MHVLVNARNLTATGPKALAIRLLPRLGPAAPGARITALLPDLPEFRALELGDNVEPVFWPRGGKGNDLARLRELYVEVPRTARARQPDVCLTLGDIAPLALSCPQVVFLHLSLLVYGLEELAGMHAWGPAKRRYLEWHFGRAARGAAHMIVQTPVMARRLGRRYGIPDARITCIGQPPAAPLSSSVPPPDAMLSTGNAVKLLFLAAYYPHKNHLALRPLAAELRRRGLSGRVHVFITLNDQDRASAKLIRTLEQDADLVTNLGRLPLEHVAGAWCAADALFLPTLVESYGLSHVEAMAAGRPILTSDRDFSRWMCDRLALYFDPLDPRSIADVVERFIELRDGADPRGDEAALMDPETFRTAARKVLSRFPSDWDAVARRFMEVTLAAADQSPALAGAVS